MNSSLRNRLIVAFLAATVIPLVATLWIATSLLDRSLGYTTTKELDELSKELEGTAREFYQQARDALKADAVSGRISPVRYNDRLKTVAQPAIPIAISEFRESGESERFVLSDPAGNRLDYLIRQGDEVWV
jgi:hypothetical protein